MRANNIKNRIKGYFYLNPTRKLRVRELERETKSPLPSVIRYTKELEEEGILKSQKISNINLYSADRSSKTFLLEKKLFNIKQLFISRLIEYVITETHNSPIILFGSYSRGEDIEDSDIDIYIESPSKNKLNLNKFEKTLNKKIQIFKYKTISSINNKDLANNILNGVPLNGFVEVFK